jgi:hypothetical protein
MAVDNDSQPSDKLLSGEQPSGKQLCSLWRTTKRLDRRKNLRIQLAKT